MRPKLSIQERQWRAEDDARTLARATEIKEDKTRLRAATSAAKKLAKDAQKEASEYKSITKKEA